jgi:hypothetical protein
VCKTTQVAFREIFALQTAGQFAAINVNAAVGTSAEGVSPRHAKHWITLLTGRSLGFLVVCATVTMWNQWTRPGVGHVNEN